MAKHRPKRRPRRGPTRRIRQAEREPELPEQIEQLLAEPHPLLFLEYASSFANLLGADAARLAEETGVDAETLIATLLAAGDASIDALLLALSAYLPDRVPAPLGRAGRQDRPPWLTRLGDAKATRAVAIEHVLGDADDLAVEVRLADGSVFCMVVLVDHNLGTVVTDAFALDEPLTQVVQQFEEVAEPGTAIRDIPLADAGARLREAADAAELVEYLPDTGTWPQIRPLLQWVVRLLPSGGTGWPHDEVSDRVIDRLVREITAEPGTAWGPDAADVVETLLRFAASSPPGDPLRWSPAVVDVLFTQWLPEHGLDEREWMEQVPPAARAVIRFAHRRRDVPKVHTQATLAALGAWSLAGESKPARRRSALHQMLAGGGLDLMLDPGRVMLGLLEADAGGAEALDRLDAEPLPAEPLHLAEVPHDVVDRVRSIGDRIADVVGRYFDDPELSTAALRLLARVVAADPTPFRRKSNDDLLAAAVAWMAAKANDAFGAGRTVKGMTAAFGQTGSAAQRAKGLLESLGRTWEGAYSKDLGDPALLTSRRRAAMITERDRLRAAAR